MKHTSTSVLILSGLMAASAASANPQNEPSITVSGLIETSVSQFEHDAVVAAIDTIELSFSAQLNEIFSADVVLLDENLGTRNHTGAAVDTAVINANLDFGLFTMGKMTVPFSSDNTHMITDTVTLEEPKGTGVMYSNAAGKFDYSVYVMTPDNDYTQTGDNQFADLSGATGAYKFNDYSDVHFDVVNVDGNFSSSAAFAGYAGNWDAILQYTNMHGESEPRVNAEVAYSVTYGTFAVALQRDGSSKEYRLYSFSKALTDDLNGAVEYKENVTDEETTFTMQLAYSF